MPFLCLSSADGGSLRKLGSNPESLTPELMCQPQSCTSSFSFFKKKFLFYITYIIYIYIYTHTHTHTQPINNVLIVSGGQQRDSAIHTCLQFSRSVMSNSLQPHGLQHTRPPCPSTTPGAYSNSCPSSR